MKEAVEEAYRGMKANEGGPFGAVIVRSGDIIARAHNQVIHTKDPTAHAEIQAIRLAAAKLGKFDLSDCEIYSTCEPCPMCLGAIFWARIPRLYFGCSRRDAAASGFSDDMIYEAIIKRDLSLGGLTAISFGRKDCLPLMDFWNKKLDKISY